MDEYPGADRVEEIASMTLTPEGLIKTLTNLLALSAEQTALAYTEARKSFQAQQESQAKWIEMISARAGAVEEIAKSQASELAILRGVHGETALAIKREEGERMERSAYVSRLIDLVGPQLAGRVVEIFDKFAGAVTTEPTPTESTASTVDVPSVIVDIHATNGEAKHG